MAYIGLTTLDSTGYNVHVHPVKRQKCYEAPHCLYHQVAYLSKHAPDIISCHAVPRKSSVPNSKHGTAVWKYYKACMLLTCCAQVYSPLGATSAHVVAGAAGVLPHLLQLCKQYPDMNASLHLPQPACRCTQACLTDMQCSGKAATQQ